MVQLLLWTQGEGRGLQAVDPRRAGAERHQSVVHSGHRSGRDTPGVVTSCGGKVESGSASYLWAPGTGR